MFDELPNNSKHSGGKHWRFANNAQITTCQHFLLYGIMIEGKGYVLKHHFDVVLRVNQLIEYVHNNCNNPVSLPPTPSHYNFKGKSWYVQLAKQTDQAVKLIFLRESFLCK